MTMRATLGLLLAFTPAGCGSPKAGARGAAESSTARAADSLVLTTSTGTEVWFTDARSALDSTGHPCVERVMEIRRAGKRIPIPLLYTGSEPRQVDDSTIEAAIWLRCHPGNVYRVSLTTGYPVRVR